MFKKTFLAALLAFGLGMGSVFATGDQLPYVPIKKLTEMAATPTDDTDFIPVYDASSDSTKKLDVDRFTFKDPSDDSVTHAGPVTFGPGTKTDGWVVLDTLESSSVAIGWGTIGANIALDGSSTYFIKAYIIGIGPTQTSLNASYVATGTFYRTGTGAVTAVSTGTVSYAETADAVSMAAYLAANINGVDVRYVGSAATEIDWAASVRYMKVTTDGT